MKRIDPFARTLTALFATGMLMVAPQLRAENVPQVVKVIRVEGRAQWSTDSKHWKDINAGDVLKPGSVIQTSDKSLVDVILGDRDVVETMPMSVPTPGAIAASAGSGGGGGGGGDDEMQGNVIRIFSMTMVGVDKLTVDRTGVDEVSDTQLDLRAGQIFANVKKLSKQSRYEVKIPNGVAGIRGSGILFSSTGIVRSYSGSAVVSIIAGNGSQITAEVPTGKSFDPLSGLVTEMNPAELKRLELIFNDLRPVSNALADIFDRYIRKDHTILFCSPVDGTSL
jgi:FecR protein